MKPNAVTLEPCGLIVLQPLSEHNVVTVALPLSEHNVVTICSFGTRRKLAFEGAVLLRLFFFHVKYYPDTL